HQFKESCRGIADACRALDTPVTGGNVSFYNESPTGAVDPTPVVVMVGLLSRVDRAVPSHARARGDAIFVLGETRAELGASQLWEAVYGFAGGTPPRGRHLRPRAGDRRRGAGAGAGRAGAGHRDGGRARGRPPDATARYGSRAPRRPVAAGIFHGTSPTHGRLTSGCAASLASPASPTRHASPTSGCTACSTGGRSPRA